MTTTTVTTKLQSAPTRRVRLAFAALASAALLASSGIAVSRIVDEPSSVGLQATNDPAEVGPVTVATLSGRVEALDVCTSLAWACIYTGSSSGLAAADVCSSLAWACIYTPQSAG